MSRQDQMSGGTYLHSLDRVRNLSDIERVRHLSETTDGSSVAGSSMTSGGGVPVVSYKDIAAACDNWDPINKLGEGGFGQVFKGVWKHQEVAIKTIKKDKYLVNEDIEHRNKSIQQCFKEINLLNSIRSEFIVPIIAHSEANFNGTWEPCIVYQWMPNGSLDDRLQKKKNTPALTWIQRYNIGLGVANGIQFLHTHGQDQAGGKQLIHGDIKSANILLDKNFEPKIGDFGLAREVDGGKSKYFVLSTIYGTQFYLPQDFLRSKKLSAKVDTYSFGVILFDLITGKRPQTKSGKEYLLDIMRESESLPQEYVDKSWPDSEKDSNVAKILYKIGKQCTQDRAKNRPQMEEVFQDLKRSKYQVGNSSPSPYEIQQRFDSQNRGGNVIKCDGFVVNDNVNLIDLSSPENLSQASLTDSGTQSQSFMIPSTITQEQSLNIPSNPVPYYGNEESNFLPAVISDAIPTVISDAAPSFEIPMVVNSDQLSSSSTLSASHTISNDSREEDDLDTLERDIEESAQLLSDMGFL